MKYRFILKHKSEYSISLMCRVLQVSRSGYNAWRDRPVSQRERANQMLWREIKAIHEQYTSSSRTPSRTSRDWARLGSEVRTAWSAHPVPDPVLDVSRPSSFVTGLCQCVLGRGATLRPSHECTGS